MKNPRFVGCRYGLHSHRTAGADISGNRRRHQPLVEIHHQAAVGTGRKIADPLPRTVLEAYDFMPFGEAIKQIHFPDSEEKAAMARKRFAFEELFFIQLAVLRQRVRLNQETARAIPLDAKLMKEFTQSLPFSLTDAQRKTAWQILKDMEKPHPANRLLQGDVGSGKTVVAMMAALAAAKNGGQVAVMVPPKFWPTSTMKTFPNCCAPWALKSASCAPKLARPHPTAKYPKKRRWIWQKTERRKF